MNAQIPPVAPTVQPVMRTTCPYCGVGCGVLASPDGAGGASIAGDPDHPANFGRLCSKGSALGETLGLETRLLHPMARGRDGRMARADWDTAIGSIAQAFGKTIETHGPDAVAIYLSGQLLTEDYYAANKLAKGFLGTANVDTNSRLCMASSVAGHRRAFGSDTVPGVYADLDEADLVVLIGSNAAWCHPILFRRLEAARAMRGTKLVVIDPRRTATGDEADLFLPVNPGKDTVLFAGLLAWLADHDALDHAYIDAHTTGLADTLAGARAMAPDIAAVARETGVSAADLVQFYTLFATHERAVTCYSQGVNQSAQGTDKVNAIINVHLATGRIGRPGMGPFSLTGQPNAMGGREVGGLANQLAAHMNFTPVEIDRVRRFWQAPRLAEREGLKAVAMFEAIAAGRIKALWIMGTNPAVSLPRAGAMREALESLDFLVVSENVASNDTLSCRPHLVLPALAWGEKDGTVTNSERRISRQRAFLPPPGEARPDWWAIAQVGRRLGFDEAFAWRSAADVFREHAALSAFENDGSRDFDLSGLAMLDDAAFNIMAPVQWPVRSAGDSADKRFFADGHFFTPDHRARFVTPKPARLARETSTDFPFILNTGRIRDQWHTMTRTGLSPRLGAHLPVPFVEIHPSDATKLGIEHGGLVSLRSAHGSAVVEARLSVGQKRGALFAPIHWSDATSSNARINDLVARITDPVSGQPESKATPVAAMALPVRYRGFVLSRRPVTELPATWWAKVALEGGAGYLTATDLGPEEWKRHTAKILLTSDYAEYVDAPGGVYRAAAFDEAGALTGAVFLSPSGAPASWDGLKALLAARTLSSVGRRNLLSGRGEGQITPRGPLVCACFAVSAPQIEQALASESGADVARLGQLLRAGTNCGSCVPELKKLIRQRAMLDMATITPPA
ncbi:nitrate reductase [Ancylobacter amanitiformis]|uniref:Assimilatory nitrate reductase catalytic subunit n=1 Tax=Ancylobacter amanitiformis TaxID=217069 RepID=A0ABU0LU33_9HYPH|nr:nitrate reductase [Ancylobacter amanitiformis]MDQ0512113.1 assimilatory nitrate reductase catalytic subunit [Ancylobacter amanitiformis]